MSDHDEVPPWLDAPRAWRELGDAREDLAPPPLPPELRARARRGLLARAAGPRRAMWAALAVAAAALVALALWWPMREASVLRDAGPAQIEVLAEPLDAGVPIEDAHVPEPAPLRRDLPFVSVVGNGCGLDVDVPLAALPEDVATLLLVLAEHPPDPARARPVATSCAGSVVTELDATLFADAPAGVSVPIELSPPTTRCGASYTIAVCARQRDGRIALGGPEVYPGDDVDPMPTSWPISTRERDWGRHPAGMILTPSGPVAPNDIEAGHAVVTISNPWLWADMVDSAWPPLYAARVTRIRREPRAGVTELRLEAGRVAVVPSHTEVWLASQPGLRRAADVVAGDVVLDSRGTRVRVVEVLHEALARAELELDVSEAGFLFVDDVLVRGSGPPPPPLRTTPYGASELLAPRVERVEDPIRVLSLPSSECSLRVDVEVTSLPASLRSVAVAYAPHRGRAGERHAIDCSEAQLGVELPRALIERAPQREDGLRALGVELPAWDEANGDWHPRDPGRAVAEPIECSHAYDVIACARDASGALAPFGDGRGAWAITGPACFAEGTLVASPEGPRAIETLQRGERLLTVDPSSGETREVRLTARIDRGVREIVELVLDDGGVLRVTAEHPLYDARAERFRAAGELDVGDLLMGEGGRAIVVVERRERGERARVYDLSVDGAHTYLAGGALAHNY